MNSPDPGVLFWGGDLEFRVRDGSKLTHGNVWWLFPLVGMLAVEEAWKCQVGRWTCYTFLLQGPLRDVLYEPSPVEYLYLIVNGQYVLGLAELIS